MGCIGIKTGSASQRLRVEADAFVGTASEDMSIHANTDLREVRNCSGKQPEYFTTTEANRTNQIITQDYADVFVDVPNHDYNVKDINSQIYESCIIDDAHSGLSSETWEKDLAGRSRYRPIVSAGALELAVNFQFNTFKIMTYFEERLRYYPYGFNNYYDFGVLVDSESAQYPRAASSVRINQLDMDQYIKESKILVRLKPIENQETITEKEVTVVGTFQAVFDYNRYTLFITKPEQYNAGLFLKLFGDRQYIFSYDEQSLVFTVGVLNNIDKTLSGGKSVINNVKFGR